VNDNGKLFVIVHDGGKNAVFYFLGKNENNVFIAVFIASLNIGAKQEGVFLHTGYTYVIIVI
jgi:hypothetical protein